MQTYIYNFSALKSVNIFDRDKDDKWTVGQILNEK
jgi:hypothetical protein